MISRYLVIALAFGAAGMQLYRGAHVEALGLACLGIGLVMLRLSSRRPALRPLAWAAFGGTVIAMILVAARLP